MTVDSATPRHPSPQPSPRVQGEGVYEIRGCLFGWNVLAESLEQSNLLEFDSISSRSGLISSYLPDPIMASGVTICLGIEPTQQPIAFSLSPCNQEKGREIEILTGEQRKCNMLTMLGRRGRRSPRLKTFARRLRTNPPMPKGNCGVYCGEQLRGPSVSTAASDQRMHRGCLFVSRRIFS